MRVPAARPLPERLVARGRMRYGGRVSRGDDQLDFARPAPAAPAVEGVLEGEVIRVTYTSEATGFRVLRVRVAGQAEPETVVGVVPVAPPGSRVRVTGTYVEDSRHGRQFKATTLLVLAPATLAGIERYLGSGLVPGIGPVYAKRIVEKFGERTLEVLDRSPERLREVPGLGARRIEGIAGAWSEHREIGAIMVFLQAHGASPALAARIHARFGAQAMTVVSKSPYRLALDVWGIGFKTADEIARSVGIPADSPERAQAGVLHVLHELAGRGDVYAEEAALVEQTAAMLECELVAAEQAVAALASTSRIRREVHGEVTAIYAPELYDAEVRTATRLAALVREVEPIPHAARAIAEFERQSGLTLDETQRRAIDAAAQSKVLIVTGGPGTGKTTIVRALLALFDMARIPVALAAPTGRAAKRMSEATGRDAATLHRLLEFEPRRGNFMRHSDRALEVGGLVVDETSMVPIVLADALLGALPDHARLVLVGDVDQLPSVGPGAVLRDVIDSGCVPVVRLSRVFRQGEDSSIIANAHRIHDGIAPLGAVRQGEQFYVFDRQGPEEAIELMRELVTKRIPRAFGLDPRRDVQILTPTQRGAAGAIALNELFQAELNPPSPERAEVCRGNRTLRVGDKVMQLKNDYDKEIFNGDVGQVAGVHAEERTVTVRFDEREVAFAESELDQLGLAYATTVHKSQGSEYPAIVMPLMTQHFIMLSRNLLYTAVTRAKQLVILIVHPRALSLALAEVRRESRKTRLAERLREIAGGQSPKPASASS